MNSVQQPACSPLTDEHCKIIDTVLQGCTMQDELIGLCQQAGLPGVDSYVKDNNRLRSMAQGIRQAFFPGHP